MPMKEVLKFLAVKFEVNDPLELCIRLRKVEKLITLISNKT